MTNDDKQALSEIVGVSVETALTDAQVAQAILLEKQLGIHGGECAFFQRHEEPHGNAGSGSLILGDES